jgi:hypothetical protein
VSELVPLDDLPEGLAAQATGTSAPELVPADDLPESAEPPPNPNARLGQILAITDDASADEDAQIIRLQEATKQPSELIRQWLPGTRQRFLDAGRTAEEFRKRFPTQAAAMEAEPRAASIVRRDTEVGILERLGKWYQARSKLEEQLTTRRDQQDPAALKAAEAESSATLGAVVSPSTAPREMVRRTEERQASESGRLSGVERVIGKGWSFNPAAFFTEAGAEGWGMDPEKTKEGLVSQKTPGALQAEFEFKLKQFDVAKVYSGAADAALRHGAGSPEYKRALIAANDAGNALGAPPDTQLGPGSSPESCVSRLAVKLLG